MKKHFIILSLLILHYQLSIAQWTPLNSTTTNYLNDVDFLTSNYGVIVGNSGTILLTQDGGSTWNDINHNSIFDDIHSVSVINFDTILISTRHSISYTIGSVYKTTDGGLNWNFIRSDQGLIHKMELNNLSSSKIFTLGNSLVSSNDLGASWDTLITNTSTTVSIDQLKFANKNVGHASGIVSGIVSNSAYFYRTENAGKNWYVGDVFSFPNSDALSAMCFINPDTALVFMQRFVSWNPSNFNSLIKIFDFKLYSAFPGDTVFTFTSMMVKDTMPAYSNDAYFIDSKQGFSLGNDGIIYSTVDGGLNWSSWYNVNFNSLVQLDFVGNIGYAVGENGSLVKYFGTTGIPTFEKDNNLSIFPNPTTNYFNLKTLNSKNLTGALRIYNSLGQFVLEEKINGSINQIDISKLRSGIYEIEFISNELNYSKKEKVIKY